MATPTVSLQPGITRYQATTLQLLYYRLIKPFGFIIWIISKGIAPFLLALVCDPSLFLSLRRSRQIFFGGAFGRAAPSLDEEFRAHKVPLLAEASGIVLDLGSGTGLNLMYFNPRKISRLILVEPNPAMHTALLANAKRAGFSDEQTVLCACGAEEEEQLFHLANIKAGDVDTVVSVLALCGIPGPRNVIASLYTYLKPGGKFIWFEHVRSHDPATAAFQELITPIWSAVFFGCQLHRATEKWITEGHEWEEVHVESLPEETEIQHDQKRLGWAKKKQ